MRFTFDADARVFAARAPARARAAAVAGPVVRDRLTPYVNAHVAACARYAGGCVPCFSLVRRYLDGERRGTHTHFDLQALVTAVVSLNTAGVDFDGGLSVLGYAATAPDPQCADEPWKNKEASGGCGLGFELALILPGLMSLHRKRRRLH